jgi:restriction system protein
MGAIWFSGASFLGSLSEIVGYKSGLALSTNRFRRLFKRDDYLKDFWPPALDQSIRIRSEVYEALVARLLFAVGNTDSADTTPFSIRLYRKYRDLGLEEVFKDTMAIFLQYLQHALKNPSANKLIDPTPPVEQAKEKHGLIGARIVLDLFKEMDADLHRSPWGRGRNIDWKDVVELESLFKDEKLDAAYGRFFDQRFIDYLHRNFPDIDDINWRKFEGLAAEFFDREGFRVDIGPGRADEGVDIRVWSPTAQPDAPATILVQCKRQKEKVAKVVVKALYADVVYEKAGSGLIVTTSALSPGAKRVCTARGYPVSEANRKTLREWLAKMRTPRTGVFLGE